MFSKLRPHHRRIPSNPTSPTDQPTEPPSHADHAHPKRHHDANNQEATNRPPPLSLQSVARVQSPEGTFVSPRRGAYERDPRAQFADSAKDTRGRDSYGFSVQGRLPYGGSQRPDSAGNASAGSYTSPQYPRQQSGMNGDTSRSRPPEISPASVTSPEIQGQNGQPNKKSPSSFSSSTPTLVEPVQPRPGKGRLNLLNPMSLLARRRTSQAVEKLAPQSLVSNRNGTNFNDNFDPRIRGTVVHDFSAPRAPPRRNPSALDVRTEGNPANNLKYQRSPNGDLNSADESVTSPWSGGNHTPVFTEDFEEEQYPNAGPHVRKASDVTDLPLPQPPYAKGVAKPAESNTSSKSNDSVQKQYQDQSRISTLKPISNIPQMPDHPPPAPPKSDVSVPIAAQRISIDTSATPPKAASSRKGRSCNVSEVSAKDAAIPKHMKSTSSRFSFDMIGAAEQERLLEDRHRQKALEKKAEQNEEGNEDDRVEDEFENDYDYDDMDEDDGLEERIPGVNADLDEDDYSNEDLEEPIPGADDEEDSYQALHPDETLGGFKFQQCSLPTPMSPTSPGMVSTPRDADGEIIGFAVTKNSPWVVSQALESNASPASPMPLDIISPILVPELQGLGIRDVNTNQHIGSMISDLPGNTASQHIVSTAANLPSQLVEDFPRQATLDDDDMYFDDGMIGSPDETDDVEFDESVFDNIDTDQYGRPLKSLPSLPTLYSPPMLTDDPSPSLNKASDGPRTSADMADGTSSSIVPNAGLAPQPSISGQRQTSMGPQTLPQQNLTIDTLAAYQQALAAAAFTAAANGKFRRDSINPSEQDDTQPGLVTDSSHTSHYEPFSPAYDVPEDDFDYDDLMQDDDIIACANAEALANDDDGFYGQEFGFYSAPGSNETEFGGYFRPRGASGVARGPSNRIVSREPNLTPITERSEYSNRNSFMSFAMHGSNNNNLVSPGLAQLASMLRSPMDNEGDMSFDALLKLRRGAWGGSQASLHSSNGGSPKSAQGVDDGSPVGGAPPWTSGGALTVPNPNQNQKQGYGPPGAGHKRKNSAYSLHSEGASATSSPPASPTLTMNFSPLDGIQERKSYEDQHEAGYNGEHGEVAKKEREIEKEGAKKHRYTNSAESISYTKDEDPSGGPARWVLERRRTGEHGEIECEREVVRGGI